MRRITIAFLGVGTAFLGLLAVAQLDHTTWTEYLGNADSAHYSALKQIDKSNVGSLQIAWTYPADKKDEFEFSPLVVGNIAYVVAKGGSLVALDASTGQGRNSGTDRRFSWEYGVGAARLSKLELSFTLLPADL